MGYNSLLFIPNDNLDEAHREPERFADALLGAINMSCVEPGPQSLGGRFSDFTIPYCAHADSLGLVAVGGNYAVKVMQTHQGYKHRHCTEEGDVELLKVLAAKLGYSVRKKTK